MGLAATGGAAAVGYLLGTIPTADLVGRRLGGPDLRRAGSGNPGAANAAAVLGPTAGLAILVGDVTKGAVAARLGLRLGGPAGAQIAASAAVVSDDVSVDVSAVCVPELESDFAAVPASSFGPQPTAKVSMATATRVSNKRISYS